MTAKIYLLAILGLLLAAPAAGASDGTPKYGTVVMRIKIPYIGVNIPVVEGNSPNNEDGPYPTHYRSTNWPNEGQTVAISAHHLTHALPGANGGPFLNVDRLKKGSAIYLTMRRPFGIGTFRYRVVWQKEVFCGVNSWNCLAALRYFINMQQSKLILTTCIGNGSWRRIVWALPWPLKRQ